MNRLKRLFHSFCCCQWICLLMDDLNTTHYYLISIPFRHGSVWTTHKHLFICTESYMYTSTNMHRSSLPFSLNFSKTYCLLSFLLHLTRHVTLTPFDWSQRAHLIEHSNLNDRRLFVIVHAQAQARSCPELLFRYMTIHQIF